MNLLINFLFGFVAFYIIVFVAYFLATHVVRHRWPLWWKQHVAATYPDKLRRKI